MLEKMKDFFESRLDGYEEHVLCHIDSAADDVMYHYDTPLTVPHETEALLAAGFSAVKVLKNWGATHTLQAIK